MTSRSSKNRQTTRPNTRRWNRLKAAVLGTSVLLNLVPLSAAEEPTADSRRSVSSGAESQPAAERWKRLKTQYDFTPAPATRPPRIEQPTRSSDGSGAAVIRPIPDEQSFDFKAITTSSDSSQAEPTAEKKAAGKSRTSVKTATAPAKPTTIKESEPEWVLPVPVTSTELTPEATIAAQRLTRLERESTTVNFTDPLADEQKVDSLYEETVKSKTPAETSATRRGTPRPLDNPATSGPPRKTTQVRRIGDIAPLADFDRDTEIKAYAAEKAREFNVKFGGEKYTDRNFPQIALAWAQPSSKYYPLYFEDPALERYGHSHNHYLQPVISSARFTTQIALLPYQMTITHPWELHSPLGWYRPGDVVPKLHYQFPWNTKAAVVEAATVTGIIFAIP